MAQALKTVRFNFLLTKEQKQWLIKKAQNFSSCGDIVRSLIQQAMDKEHSDGENA